MALAVAIFSLDSGDSDGTTEDNEEEMKRREEEEANREKLRQAEAAKIAKAAAEKAAQDKQLKEEVEALAKENMILKNRLSALEGKESTENLSSSTMRRSAAKSSSKKLYFPTNADAEQTRVLEAVFGRLEK